MDVARAVDRPGEEEDPLGERGHTGVDVGCDPNVSEGSQHGLDLLGLEHGRFHGVHRVMDEFSCAGRLLPGK